MMRFLSRLLARLGDWKYPLLLLVFLLIAYLPLSTFLFALKNDAFIYNFPNKQFFSESLQHGSIPFWNPYLNYGFPLFADPGFAWWQPITWLFGWIGYTPYTLTIEVILYLYIASAGMYWLGRQLSLSAPVAFVMAAMFGCCGFFVGNLQHINFLTCAAFLPWLTGSWLNLQARPSFKRALAAAIATYLLCTGGHPAIPIGTLYFMCALGGLYLLLHRKTILWSSVIAWNSCYLLLTLFLLSPAIASWLQLMPLYARSEVVDQANTAHLGFTVNSYLSFFAPFTTIRNDSFFDTDLSMRNGYFSLIGIVSFIAVLAFKKNKLQHAFLGAGTLLLVLSLGGDVKQALFSRLPLLSFIRTNGEFRVFALLSFIIVTGYGLERLSHDQRLRQLVLQIFKTLAITLLIAITILSAVLIYSGNEGPYVTLSRASLRATLAQLSFLQAALAGTTTCLFLAALYWWKVKKPVSTRGLALLLILDLTVNTWLLLPFTGVGSRSVAQLATMLQQFPEGFPPPPLSHPSQTHTVNQDQELVIGNASWYDKQIVHRTIEYPSHLKATQNFLAANDPALQQTPFAFLQKKNGMITQQTFSPNEMRFVINMQASDTFVLLQNKYPGWKITVDDRPVLMDKKGYVLTVPVAASSKRIHFRFRPFAE